LGGEGQGRGLIGGVFRTEKDAFRFALFEAGGNSACVRVLPGKPKRRRAAVIHAGA